MSDERNVLSLDDHVAANKDAEWVEVGNSGEEIKVELIQDGWLKANGGAEFLQTILQGDDDAIAKLVDQHVVEPDFHEFFETDEITATHIEQLKVFSAEPLAMAILEPNNFDMFLQGNLKMAERAGLDVTSQMQSG